MTRVVTEDQLRAVLGYDRDALAQVEQGYVWLHERNVSMPPVFHIEIDDQSAVDVKGAFVPGLDHFAIKMASGFYGNAAKGLISSSSVVLLISAHTGFCEAVFIDNGYLMNLRTALAGAVAANHLSVPDARTVGIVGTGVQARAQLRALMLVRPLTKVLVWGRDAEKAGSCAEDMRKHTDASVVVMNDLAALAGQSDILITTTQTTSPLIDSGWIREGTHVTAMGSDLPGKQELDSTLLARADLLVCDSIAQCGIGGELQHVAQSALARRPVELSSVIMGKHPGRSAAGAITICDMTGLGILDTAIAVAAFDRLNAD